MKSILKIFGLIAFMALGVGMAWFGNNMRTEARMAQFWPETDATVIRSEWLDSAKDHADIRYRYTVNGAEFESDQQFIGMLENGTIELNSGRNISQYMLLDRFPLGKKITIHYDPDEPGNAVLFNEVDSNGTVLIYFGIAFMLAGFLGLFQVGAGLKSANRKPTRRQSRA